MQNIQQIFAHPWAIPFGALVALLCLVYCLYRRNPFEPDAYMDALPHLPEHPMDDDGWVRMGEVSRYMQAKYGRPVAQRHIFAGLNYMCECGLAQRRSRSKDGLVAYEFRRRPIKARLLDKQANRDEVVE